MSVIIGRKNIIKKFEGILGNRKSSLNVLYGRRRVGKTYLIQQYFQDKGIYLETAGTYSDWEIPEKKIKEDAERFYFEVTSNFKTYSKRTESPEKWSETFLHLSEAIRERQAVDPDEKIIIFFDEVPWLCRDSSSDFKSSLEHFVNTVITKTENIYLFVCGSATSWMLKNIINEKGSFYDRVNESLRIRPFSLYETKEYLRTVKKANFTDSEFAKLYMALGGVAGYLNRIPMNSSVFKTTIHELFFSEGSKLQGEFETLYEALFQGDRRYQKIVESMGTATKELTSEEIFTAAKLQATTAEERNEMLDSLVKCDILLKYPSFKSGETNTRYRISDMLSIFHLKWIKELKLNHEQWNSGEYWALPATQAAFNAWKGYAFESICFLHKKAISDYLKIGAASPQFCTWSARAAGGYKGAQIDMLIRRADKKFHIMEMKFYEEEQYTVTTKYNEELENKINALASEEKTTKENISVILLTILGMKDTTANKVIANSLTLKDLMQVDSYLTDT